MGPGGAAEHGSLADDPPPPRGSGPRRRPGPYIGRPWRASPSEGYPTAHASSRTGSSARRWAAPGRPVLARPAAGREDRSADLRPVSCAAANIIWLRWAGRKPAPEMKGGRAIPSGLMGRKRGTTYVRTAPCGAVMPDSHRVRASAARRFGRGRRRAGWEDRPRSGDLEGAIVESAVTPHLGLGDGRGRRTLFDGCRGGGERASRSARAPARALAWERVPGSGPVSGSASGVGDGGVGRGLRVCGAGRGSSAAAGGSWGWARCRRDGQGVRHGRAGRGVGAVRRGRRVRLRRGGRAASTLTCWRRWNADDGAALLLRRERSSE